MELSNLTLSSVVDKLKSSNINLSSKKIKIILSLPALYLAYKIANSIGKTIKRWRIRNSLYQPRIVIIGAGLSGLCMAIKLKHELGYNNFIIYEMLSDLGGTWYANTYPGCCCDVAGHLYSYSFSPNPWANRAFPTQPETLSYIRSVANKYNLYDHIEFNSQITECKYNENNSKPWQLTVKNLKSNLSSSVSASTQIINADFICSATGILTIPKYPSKIESDIPKFKGKIMHSAEWDHNYNFNEKKVAIIGTGCSSLQVVPNLWIKYPNMQCMDVYQRSPGHIFPKRHGEFSSFRKIIYYLFPWTLKLHRWLIYWRGELIFYRGLIANSKANKALTDVCDEYRDSIITDKSLNMKFRPTNPFGAKRLLLEHGFYQTFQDEKALLITDGIKNIMETGIITEDADNTLREYDVIVFCTGYETQEYLKSIPYGIHNENTGKELKRDLWRMKDCFAYCGRTVTGFPNWFHIMGPGTGLGHSSMILIIENDCNYIKQIIEKFILSQGKYKSLDVKQNVMDEYNERSEEQMKKMVWSDEGTTSWYKNDNKRVSALFAWNTVYYWWISRKVNWNEYNLQ